MDDIIAKLRSMPGIAITAREYSWEIQLLKPDDLAFEISVPRHVFEWFVTARQALSNQEVWSDWMDYYETDGETPEQLRSEMQRDLECFIERLIASTLRVVKSQAFFGRRQSLEWRIDGDWERIALV